MCKNVMIKPIRFIFSAYESVLYIRGVMESLPYLDEQSL